MAIRIRKIDECTVALCAAVTLPQRGDLYLNDRVHHALTTKFLSDFQKEGLIDGPPSWDEHIYPLMIEEEHEGNRTGKG